MMLRLLLRAWRDLLQTAPSLYPRYNDLGTEPYQETLTLL